MLRVVLINMPFASIHAPSLALLQLQSVVRSRFPEQVEAEIKYVNNDFARFFGVGFYEVIANSMPHLYTGVGEWFFRSVAFPEAAGNTLDYFKRYYWHPSDRGLRSLLLQRRQGLRDFLASLIERHQLDRADVLGFTSLFAQNVACLALARLVKERRPEVVTVMGGANCEAPMGQVLANQAPQIDYVFSGPGLVSFPEFLGCLLRGDRPACADIDGVLTAKSADGLPVTRASLGAEKDINSELPLDYSPFLQTYRESFPAESGKLHLLFETSRGCWWGERAHCTFCGLNSQTMRFRELSAERALALFDHLLSYYPECKSFQCVDNIMPKSYLTTVLPRLHPPEDAAFFYEVKADLSYEDLGVLAGAGVRLIQPGIEALATSTLALMKKGTTAVNNVGFLRNCLALAIRPAWNLLVGFPAETEEVYRRYLDVIPALTHLPPPGGLGRVRFDRYSPYFREADHYGLQLVPMDFYAFVYPWEGESLPGLAYYFVDANTQADYRQALDRWVDPLQQVVGAWIERWCAGSPPRLQFAGGPESGRICDSRSLPERELDVGPGGRRVLEFCVRPQQVAAVRALQGEEELERLRGQRLLFEEKGKVVSLVLPEGCSGDRCQPGKTHLFY
jgi:magnesium-protoporphyrin IX monomethyl ester (oxidative) cyclase